MFKSLIVNNLSKKEFYEDLQGKINKKSKDVGLFCFILFVVKKISIYFAISIVYIFIRLIKPFIFIRFGSLDANKIGPLISLPSLYLLEKDHHIQPQNTLDIFYDGYGENRHICNNQLLKMWKRIFLTRKWVIFSDSIARNFYEFCVRFSIKTEHMITVTRDGRDVLGLAERSKLYLQFTEEEVSRAKSEIKKMGMNENDSYVCMLNRSQSYSSKTFTGRNWDYQAFRNCAIEGYMPAAEEMTKRGHYVIRMGSIVGDLMNTENPKIIEYAHKGFRTELLDIYLSANCYFIITCSSGLDGVTWFFKRPGVIVNFVHLEHINSWQSNHITIFKKYWLKRENRFMSIQEILESGAGRFLRSELYEDMGIELIDNTPEEIMDVVDEMDKRLKGTWQTSEADEELQRRFWFFFKSSSLHGVIRSRVGTEFLRQNRELLY